MIVCPVPPRSVCVKFSMFGGCGGCVAGHPSTLVSVTIQYNSLSVSSPLQQWPLFCRCHARTIFFLVFLYLFSDVSCISLSLSPPGPQVLFFFLLFLLVVSSAECPSLVSTSALVYLVYHTKYTMVTRCSLCACDLIKAEA